LLYKVATLVARNQSYKTSTHTIPAITESSIDCAKESAGKSSQETLSEATTGSFADTIVVSLY